MARDHVTRKQSVRQAKRPCKPARQSASATCDLAAALKALDFSPPPLPASEQELQRRRNLVGNVLAAFVLFDQDLDELQEWAATQKASGSEVPTSPPPRGRVYEDLATALARMELLTELLSQGDRVLWGSFAVMDLNELCCMKARAAGLAAGLHSHLQHAATEQPLDFTRGELAAVSRAFGEGVATLEADSRSTIGAAKSSQDLLPRCKGSGLAGLRARSEWRRLILRELELQIVTALNGVVAGQGEERRCRVRVERTPEGDFINLDGTRHPVNEKAANLFDAGLHANGSWFSATESGCRTRDINSLPQELRELLETGGSKGTRLKPVVWLD